MERLILLIFFFIYLVQYYQFIYLVNMFKKSKILVIAIIFILIALASGSDKDENLQTREDAQKWLIDIGKFRDNTIQGYRFEFSETTVKFWVEKIDGWHSQPDDICNYTLGDKNSEGSFPIILNNCKLSESEDFSLEHRVHNEMHVAKYGSLWYRLRPGGGDQPGQDIESCWNGWN